MTLLQFKLTIFHFLHMRYKCIYNMLILVQHMAGSLRILGNSSGFCSRIVLVVITSNEPIMEREGNVWFGVLGHLKEKLWVYFIEV